MNGKHLETKVNADPKALFHLVGAEDSSHACLLTLLTGQHVKSIRTADGNHL